MDYLSLNLWIVTTFDVAPAPTDAKKLAEFQLACDLEVWIIVKIADLADL